MPKTETELERVRKQLTNAERRAEQLRGEFLKLKSGGVEARKAANKAFLRSLEYELDYIDFNPKRHHSLCHHGATPLNRYFARYGPTHARSNEGDAGVSLKVSVPLTVFDEKYWLRSLGRDHTDFDNIPGSDRSAAFYISVPYVSRKSSRENETVYIRLSFDTVKDAIEYILHHGIAIRADKIIFDLPAALAADAAAIKNLLVECKCKQKPEEELS